MTVNHTVADGERRKVPHELVGQMHRRFNDILRRADEGYLDPHQVLRDFQAIAERRCWTMDSDGTVYFTLISEGWTGREWINWHVQHGYPLTVYVRFILGSPDFTPTPKGTVLQIGVLPGKLWATEAERTTANVRVEAARRGWKQGKEIGSDLTCLIRKAFSNQEIRAMNLLWIVGLSATINDSVGFPDLLAACADGAGPWLRACWDEPDDQWGVQNGFAAVVPQVSSQVLDS